MIRFLNKLKSITSFLEEFKKDIVESDFKKDAGKKRIPLSPQYCWTPRYLYYWEILNGIVEISGMLGIEYLSNHVKDLRQRTSFLYAPDMINTQKKFEIHFDYILNCFKNVSDLIINKIQLLEKEEKKRLDEAINCYINDCNYSAVAMAVSAIESRLFSLMVKKCPDPKLHTLTLGLLIREYLDNEDKYDKCIPKKHKYLLEHCNVYRIFSVHPKKETITRSIATSIINMTFAFLLDEKLKITSEEK